MPTTKRRFSISRDWISFGYHIRTREKRSLPEILALLRDYVRGELEFRETGNPASKQPLPKDLEVTWQWRNRPDGPLLEDRVQGVVSESRTGYLKLMLRRIERDLSRFPLDVERAARDTAKRLEERERRSRAAKAGAQRRKVWLESHKKYLAQQKRLAALLEKARTRERKRRKRSEASKKGWKTQRRKEKRT
jgi:hypothetical protein